MIGAEVAPQSRRCTSIEVFRCLTKWPDKKRRKEKISSNSQSNLQPLKPSYTHRPGAWPALLPSPSAAWIQRWSSAEEHWKQSVLQQGQLTSICLHNMGGGASPAPAWQPNHSDNLACRRQPALACVEACCCAVRCQGCPKQGGCLLHESAGGCAGLCPACVKIAGQVCRCWPRHAACAEAYVDPELTFACSYAPCCCW